MHRNYAEGNESLSGFYNDYTSKEKNNSFIDFNNDFPSNLNINLDNLLFNLPNQYNLNNERTIPLPLSITNINSNSWKSTKYTFIIYKKRRKRGRMTLKDKLEETRDSTQIHLKDKNDCKMAKIQIGYFTFLIEFLNLIMLMLKLDYNFLDLKGDYKGNINQKFRAELNNKTIKDIILESPISGKYKKKEMDYNQKIINKLENEGLNIILNIMNKKFLYFFENIYYKNLRKFNLTMYDNNSLEVNLPLTIKLFNDLLNKNKSKNSVENENYENSMKKCAKKYFFPRNN